MRGFDSRPCLKTNRESSRGAFVGIVKVLLGFSRLVSERQKTCTDSVRIDSCPCLKDRIFKRNPLQFLNPPARVMESVDIRDLKSLAVRRAGSSPALGTNIRHLIKSSRENRLSTIIYDSRCIVDLNPSFYLHF